MTFERGRRTSVSESSELETVEYSQRHQSLLESFESLSTLVYLQSSNRSNNSLKVEHRNSES